MTAKVDPEVQARLTGDPHAALDVIVSVSGPVEDLLAILPSGVVVRHVYRLSKGIACTAEARDVRVLAASSSVTAIEPDRHVSTQA